MAGRSTPAEPLLKAPRSRRGPSRRTSPNTCFCGHPERTSPSLADKGPNAEARGEELGADTTAPRTSRSRARIVLVLVLQVVCIAYVARVLWQERAELGAASSLSMLALGGLVALMLVAHLQRTYEFTYMLRSLGVREPFFQGFLLTGAGFLLNHLPLSAGLVMRAAVLKRDYALSYTRYLSLVTVNGLVNVAVAAVLGFSALSLSGARQPMGSHLLPAIFALILIGSIAVICWPPNLLPTGHAYVWRRARAFFSGIAELRGNGGRILWLALLAVSRIGVAGLRVWICFDALGIEVSPLAAGVLASTAILFSLFNLTPGNLGLRELAMGAVAAALGSSYAVGVAAASIDRVVLLGYTVVSGLPGIWSLRRRARAG